MENVIWKQWGKWLILLVFLSISSTSTWLWNMYKFPIHRLKDEEQFSVAFSMYVPYQLSIKAIHAYSHFWKKNFAAYSHGALTVTILGKDIHWYQRPDYPRVSNWWVFKALVKFPSTIHITFPQCWYFIWFLSPKRKHKVKLLWLALCHIVKGPTWQLNEVFLSGFEFNFLFGTN